MTEIVIVNASRVLRDEQVEAAVAALQLWDDTMLRPAWQFDRCEYSMLPFGTLPSEGDSRWPIFLNRHSADVGVGGWHDDSGGRVFGRCFVGDCIRYGVSWTVDVSHEAAEMRGDPTIDKTAVLSDGRIALFELCDPVESDADGIVVDGVLLSDFVLPAYFNETAGPWDFKRVLAGPCPTLAPGGYQSIYENGTWTQLTARWLGGPVSYRAERFATSLRMPKMVPK